MSAEDSQRFCFIDQMLGWEGEINASHISAHFSLTRQAASKILKKYRQQHPSYSEYNPSKKAHIATPAFNDFFAQSEYLNNFSSYLNIIQPQSSAANQIENHFCYETEAPLRHINPMQVRPILKAIREQQAIDIGYISLSSPDYLDRIIQPHAMIFDGLRWHVRAFCNKNQAFRDFTLSRFNGVAEVEGKATKYRADDQAWNTQVEVVIAPDPRFSPAQKRIIEHDFQMENGCKVITSRAALVPYLLRRLRIDSYQNSPEQQQIVLTQECYKKIAQYLPSSF